jgi:hypothetical protein
VVFLFINIQLQLQLQNSEGCRTQGTYEVRYTMELKHSVALVRERTIPSASLLSAKLDRGCRVVSTTDPYGRILGSLVGVATFSSNELLNYTHET